MQVKLIQTTVRNQIYATATCPPVMASMITFSEPKIRTHGYQGFLCILGVRGDLSNVFTFLMPNTLATTKHFNGIRQDDRVFQT